MQECCPHPWLSSPLFRAAVQWGGWPHPLSTGVAAAHHAPWHTRHVSWAHDVPPDRPREARSGRARGPPLAEGAGCPDGLSLGGCPTDPPMGVGVQRGPGGREPGLVGAPTRPGGWAAGRPSPQSAVAASPGPRGQRAQPTATGPRLHPPGLHTGRGSRARGVECGVVSSLPSVASTVGGQRPSSVGRTKK